MNCRDVRVIEPGERERFLTKTSARALVTEEVGRQHLDRDLAIEPLVVCEIDLAIATRANQRDERVMAQGAANEHRHRRRRAAYPGLIQGAPC